MDINELREGMLIRMRNFKTRYEIPDHWGSEMLRFCNNIFEISNIVHFSEEDDGYEPHHIHLKDIVKKERDGVEGYYFLSNDFQKVNTLNDGKRKSKSSS